MTTVRDLIKGSLAQIRAIAVGEAMDADEATDLFGHLNRMLDSWSTQGDLVYTDTLVTYTLSAGTGSYTIGSGATINTPRPISIKTAYITDGEIDTPLEIIDEYKFARISDKTTQGKPEYLYYKTGYPTGAVALNAIPDAAYALNMFVTQPLSAVASLDTVISMPPGYEQAIELNFAKLIAPMYGKSLTMDQQELASDSLKMIKAANRAMDVLEAKLDVPGGMGAIYTPIAGSASSSGGSDGGAFSDGFSDGFS